jgi:hypothetical protein
MFFEKFADYYEVIIFRIFKDDPAVFNYYLNHFDPFQWLDDLYFLTHPKKHDHNPRMTRFDYMVKLSNQTTLFSLFIQINPVFGNITLQALLIGEIG